MQPEPKAPTIRAAGADDADRIAALHVASWRATYRGMLADAYLDGPIEAERRAFWTERLRHPRPDLLTLVAEPTPVAPLVGFVCVLRRHDARWGTLIDNLHVDPARKGAGLGRRLMATLASQLVADGEAGPVHLFVLRANHAAAAFYARLGGEEVEQLIKTEPDGSPLAVSRIAWPSAAALAIAAEEPRP